MYLILSGIETKGYLKKSKAAISEKIFVSPIECPSIIKPAINTNIRIY